MHFGVAGRNGWPANRHTANTDYLNEVWKEFARDDFSGVEIGFPIRMVVRS
jgi:hypothetical protein